MKALIRGDEVIVEPFDPWIQDHIEWMCTARPDGNGYSLVNVEPADPAE